MKKIIKKIKIGFTWAFSKKVLQAINDGASYEEVERLVKNIADGRRR